jgi:hypothetical protein
MPKAKEIRYDRRSGPRDRMLRVGDREREAVGDILRREHVDGRLNSDEFQQRLERCLTAKTYADLDQLVADFPSEEVGRSGQPWGRRPWPFPLVPLALIAAIVVFAGGHLIWLTVPLFFLFVVGPLQGRSSARGYGHAGSGCGPRYTTRTRTRV